MLADVISQNNYVNMLDFVCVKQTKLTCAECTTLFQNDINI